MKRLLIVAVLMLLVLVCGWLTKAAYMIRSGQSTAVDARSLDVSLAYVNRNAIYVYRGHSVATPKARVPSGYYMLRLLGTDRDTGSFLCIARRDPWSGPSVLLRIHEDKSTCRVLPDEDNVSLCDSGILSPSVDSGCLTIRIYDLSGRVRSTLRLTIPSDEIRSVESQIQLSRSGMVAVSLGTRRQPKPHVYLFRQGGKLFQCLGVGVLPRLDPTGRMLAYVPVRYGDFSGTDFSVILYHIESKRTAKLLAWHPTRLTDLVPLVGDDPMRVDGIAWSHDSNWLVCSVERLHLTRRMLCAVEVRSTGKPRWCRLPVEADRGQWCVAD